MLDKTSRTVYPIKYHSGRDDTMEWILLGLLFCILILQIVLLWRRRTGDTQELRLALAKDASEQQLRMAQQVDQSIQNLRVENEKRMDDLQTRLEKAVAAGATEQSRILQEMEKAILKQNHEAQEKIMEKLVASVARSTGISMSAWISLSTSGWIPASRRSDSSSAACTRPWESCRA